MQRIVAEELFDAGEFVGAGLAGSFEAGGELLLLCLLRSEFCLTLHDKSSSSFLKTKDERLASAMEFAAHRIG